MKKTTASGPGPPHRDGSGPGAVIQTESGLIHHRSFMFFEDGRAPLAPRGLPSDDSPMEDAGGMYFVDFGPLFAEELRKVLRYRQGGAMCEIVFWRDEYGYGF